jgi:hypothetical protein
MTDDPMRRLFRVECTSAVLATVGGLSFWWAFGLWPGALLVVVGVLQAWEAVKTHRMQRHWREMQARWEDLRRAIEEDEPWR